MIVIKEICMEFVPVFKEMKKEKDRLEMLSPIQTIVRPA